jgi:hypothetical protein
VRELLAHIGQSGVSVSLNPHRLAGFARFALE